MKFLFIALAIMLSAAEAFCQGNNYVQNYNKFEGLALTPPIRWNSWNKFACNVDEKLIREPADAMVLGKL